MLHDPVRSMLINQHGFTAKELDAIERAALAEHRGHPEAAQAYRADAGYGRRPFDQERD